MNNSESTVLLVNFSQTIVEKGLMLSPNERDRIEKLLEALVAIFPSNQVVILNDPQSGRDVIISIVLSGIVITHAQELTEFVYFASNVDVLEIYNVKDGIGMYGTIHNVLTPIGDVGGNSRWLS